MKQTSDKLIIWIIILTQFASPFMFSGVAITLPQMGRELDASAVALGLVESVYLGLSAALLLPMGRIADATSREILFKIGLVGYCICTFTISLLPDIYSVIFVRAIQGIFAAFMMATGMAIISHKVPKEQLGRTMGYCIGAIYAGLSAGPLIAGWVTEHLGWRAVYILTFVPLAISTALAVWLLPHQWKAMTEKFDWFGSLLICASVGLLIFGSASLHHGHGGLLIAGGVLLMVLFFVLQAKLANPLLDLQAMKTNKDFSHALITQLFMYAGAFGVTFLLGLYLQSVRHYSAQHAGQILVLGPILMAIMAPICGRLADRVNKRAMTSLGVIMAIICLVLSLQLNDHSGLPILIAIILTQGLGFALFSSPNMAIVMSSVPPSQYSLASALGAKMRSLGMVLAMILITTITSIYLGEQSIEDAPQNYMQVMDTTFLIFIGLLVVACWLSVSTIKGHKVAPQQVQSN
ncbi:MFS transporter [Litoribrevibacter euphylliae]|uniref:MFS transporter n=1 Tax=Litoribrevibacter euphylliae TaxID=1834034 RepID=A0ABV7HJS9_9GAMM